MASYGAETAQTSSRLNLSRLSEAESANVWVVEDIRGHKVIDTYGESIGQIVDMLIDEERLEVRFLIVEPGQPLCLTHTDLLIPVDALKESHDEFIFIDCPCEQVADSPRYYPNLLDRFYLEEVYSYYGFAFNA